MMFAKTTATVSLLVAATSAQTIVVNGRTVAADTTNTHPIADIISNGAATGFEEVQLTEKRLTQLAAQKLSGIANFYFDSDNDLKERGAAKCKSMPGDAHYPDRHDWNTLDMLSGGALIKTVPLGSACYEGEHYDADKCEFLVNNWNVSDTHVPDPSSVMSPIYEGATCEPANAALGGNCTLGGFPSYSLNISTVADIQLGLNFARNHNLRLVVRNTGHDFLGKNTGKGALSLWTHHLRDIDVLHEYESAGGSYKGPAFKLGAGVMIYELYDVAEREGYTAVGGECRTVGVTGGYLQGGGHSPVTSLYGLASDQLLSVNLVTPDGRFITADETQNQDIFWAIRGGGGATWGVVTSMTVKVHEKMVMSGMTWDTDTVSMNITEETFWKAIDAYWSRYADYLPHRPYGYCRMSPLDTANPSAGYAWRGLPFMIPGMKLADFKELVQPLLDDWAALGVDPQLEFFEHDSFYGAWTRHFPTSVVANAYGRTGNRLLPIKNWEDPKLMRKTIDTVQELVKEGAFLVHYNMNGQGSEMATPDTSANPAWRQNMMFIIYGVTWDSETPEDEIAAINEKLTHDFGVRLKDISQGAGGYLNEGDVMDPDFQQTFYGSSYDRLVEIKRKVDPRNVFWAPTAVDSEGWYITDQPDWITRQTGRLCPKE